MATVTTLGDFPERVLTKETIIGFDFLDRALVHRFLATLLSGGGSGGSALFRLSAAGLDVDVFDGSGHATGRLPLNYLGSLQWQATTQSWQVGREALRDEISDLKNSDEIMVSLEITNAGYLAMKIFHTGPGYKLTARLAAETPAHAPSVFEDPNICPSLPVKDQTTFRIPVITLTHQSLALVSQAVKLLALLEKTGKRPLRVAVSDHPSPHAVLVSLFDQGELHVEHPSESSRSDHLDHLHHGVEHRGPVRRLKPLHCDFDAQKPKRDSC
eukprot:Protomagalhaensia_sp_Gyna_25__2226@NODE_220_length_4326_cov_28_069046_g171_i0_p2_GENE_NODE_220_length_4326_cov_28_069046_g171_i0NODE_220_length_4326_cov_28_069046_g171_i0_p2_ORF_typecomplete_len271_score38_70NAD_binding_8/PF13450_6/0_1_NODE_220_length_4326_cov_28_069046_g171_i02361048